MHARTIALLASIAITAAAHAQFVRTAQGYVAVQVDNGENGSTDPVGQLLVTALRDDLAKSPRFQEVTADPNASTLGFNVQGVPHPLVIHILTGDPEPDKSGHRTIVSSFITLNATYGTASGNYELAWCGRDKVQDEAAQLMSEIDNTYQQIASAVRGK
jgi:hypothetical protein